MKTADVHTDDNWDWCDLPFVPHDEVVSAFNRDGYVLLKDVLPPEKLREIGSEITALTLRLSDESRPLADRDTYDQAFLQVMNLWRHSDRVRRFVFGKRLACLATHLLGTAGVRLYHDQSLYKEPSGGITPAHADQHYWPLSSEKAVTAWVPLQSVPIEMGTLEFYRGSHVIPVHRDLPISDDSEQNIRKNMSLLGFDLMVQPFDLGDVSFHAGWTFHRAGPNRSSSPRSVMTVIYIDRDMTLAAPTNQYQENDWRSWMPGARIGQMIDTALNPILYERET